ncbi:MAG: hypothetical protein ACYDDT_14010, partial [Sulfuricella sp.]
MRKLLFLESLSKGLCASTSSARTDRVDYGVSWYITFPVFFPTQPPSEHLPENSMNQAIQKIDRFEVTRILGKGAQSVV